MGQRVCVGGSVGFLNVDARARSGRRKQSLALTRRGRAAAAGCGVRGARGEPKQRHSRSRQGFGFSTFTRTRTPRTADRDLSRTPWASRGVRGARRSQATLHSLPIHASINGKAWLSTPAHAHPPLLFARDLFHAVGERGGRCVARAGAKPTSQHSPHPPKQSPACRACSWRTPAPRARAPVQRT